MDREVRQHGKPWFWAGILSFLLTGLAHAQHATAPDHADRVYGWDAVVEGNGLLLMVVGVVVVFSALVILVFLMKALKWFQTVRHSRWMTRHGASEEESKEGEEGIPGVVIAAVALSIILEEESIHDEESMVLTLQALPKPYSNWWMRHLVDSQFAKRQPQTQTIIRTVDPIEGQRV